MSPVEAMKIKLVDKRTKNELTSGKQQQDACEVIVISNHLRCQQQQQQQNMNDDSLNHNNHQDHKKTPTTTTTTTAPAHKEASLLNCSFENSNQKILSGSQRDIVSYGSTLIVDVHARANSSPNGYHPSSSSSASFSSDDGRSNQQVFVSDIIGGFGWFQFFVLLFSGLREGLVGYDALIMSIILQPEENFICADNLPARELLMGAHGSPHISYLKNLTTNQQQPGWNETAQCYRSIDGGQTPLYEANGQPAPSSSWLFANHMAETGPSLVAEWSLVCQNHWLVAFIESAYFFGLMTGNLVWGYYADKIGRRPAYLTAHTISLIFGSLAVVMPSIWLFAFCRFLSAFGSIGYNIIYSIQVEIIGAKHRSFSTILNHFGWGLGVICVPLVDHLFTDYRPIIAIGPLMSLLMFPWAFWLPESSRWLMANGRFSQAKQELVRAAKFNGKTITAQLEKKIFMLEQKMRQDKVIQNKRSYRLLFTNDTLVKDTVILAYIAFVGHLFYYVLTINFAYMKNLSIEANFISSGAGEWVSVLVGAVLLKACSRKTCLSLFLFLMATSFGFQSLIDSGFGSDSLDTPLIITTNNAIGTLSSLLMIFVVLIVNQEVYPTVIRQTGTSITNTIGESGSTLAPLLIQFSRMIGPWKANAIYAAFCALGMIAAQFVTKTDDVELSDT